MRYGYTFLGWSDGETTYKTGDAINLTSENVTLTAQWQSLAETDSAYATQRTYLTGVWEYQYPNDGGTAYLEISGMEAAWNAFKAIGSYKVGAFEITAVTDTTIKFTIRAARPGMGTNNIGCTYYFDGDYIAAGSYGTYYRAESNPPLPSSDDDDVIVVSLDLALPVETEKKRG